VNDDHDNDDDDDDDDYYLAASQCYIDAAYCYRRSSVVRQSVGLSVTISSPAKTAEPIEMPFELWTRVGPRNHVFDGGSDPPFEGAILKREEAAYCKMQGIPQYRPCAAPMRPYCGITLTTRY